jgi:hypothetical protein
VPAFVTLLEDGSLIVSDCGGYANSYELPLVDSNNITTATASWPAFDVLGLRKACLEDGGAGEIDVTLTFAPDDLVTLTYSSVVKPDLSLSATNATLIPLPAELNVTEGSGGEETETPVVVDMEWVKTAGDGSAPSI